VRPAICIACGCDEDHACDRSVVRGLGDMEGCWWLRFDADAGVGVCSACEDLVRVWDSAKNRTPILPLIAERFYRQVMFMYEDKAAALAWMASPHPLLGLRAPRDAIVAGGLDDVRTLVDQIVSGAFA
jgi:hypothetical protein